MKELKQLVAILQDLQGPKLRVGRFQDGALKLNEGDVVEFEHESKLPLGCVGANGTKQIPYNYEKLAQEVLPGEHIFIDDGNLDVLVQRVEGTRLFGLVEFGGVLKDKKGMNFPTSKLSVEALPPKDLADLEFGVKLGVDYVALSFVRHADELIQLKELIAEKTKRLNPTKKRILVCSKIEKREAITHLDAIVAESDVVMVARGDLGVEVGTEQVPLLQKLIIEKCNQLGRPVITATQMLESMVSSPRPTRAEASDVANAILDGTDAVMLSAETASGAHPVLVVEVMHKIITEVEANMKFDKKWTWQQGSKVVSDAIEYAASLMARAVSAKVIVCTTHTGQAARFLSRYRPQTQILAMSDSMTIRQQLALVWGVQTTSIEPTQDIEKVFTFGEVESSRLGFVQKGDAIVMTAGHPPLQYGTTNLLKVVTVRSDYKA